jgi:hypothetical protein
MIAEPQEVSIHSTRRPPGPAPCFWDPQQADSATDTAPPTSQLWPWLDVWLDVCAFVLVSAYLTAVLFWLLLRGRLDPQVSLRKLIRAAFRRKRASGFLVGIVPETGHCYQAPIDPRLISDCEGHSRLMLFEDGRPLQPHALHDTIRQQGRGTFSHWNGVILFSASDNSDPRHNGRTYTFAEV